MKELRDYYHYGHSKNCIISTLCLVETKPSIIRDLSWMYHFIEQMVHKITLTCKSVILRVLGTLNNEYCYVGFLKRVQQIGKRSAS